MNQSNLWKTMARFEPYYFYFFVIVNTLPVLVFRYFPTLDGPSHVYNSKLLLELLRGDSPLNDFVQINRITPNLVGHVILMLLQIGFSAAIAEKLFLLAYLVLFPVFFRKTILSINPKGAMVSYFVFPFVYSYLFILGFYNFIIGIVLLFWAISLWIRYQQKFTFRRSLAMFFLISLLSLSHLFVFIIFTAIVAALEFTHAISVYVINKTKWDSCMIRSYVLKFFSFSLALTISILFISMVSEAHDTWRYTPFVDLLRWIWHVQPAKAMQYVREDDYTHWLFWAIILAGIATLVSGIKKFNRMNWKNDLIRFGFDTKNVWLLAAFGLLMGFFIAPDFVGENYGYFSSRFLLFIFLTIIVWISTQKIPTWILILTFLIVNYVSLSMINLYMDTVGYKNVIVKETINASEFIDAYSTVLPLKGDFEDLTFHFSNYLGYNKPMISLENYEASHNYFPLIWNANDIPNLNLGNHELSKNCIFWEYNMHNASRKIDYVYEHTGHSSRCRAGCEMVIRKLINDGYTLVFEGEAGYIKLYESNDHQ